MDGRTRTEAGGQMDGWTDLGTSITLRAFASPFRNSPSFVLMTTHRQRRRQAALRLAHPIIRLRQGGEVNFLIWQLTQKGVALFMQ